MIANPKDIAVEVLNGAEVEEKTVSIEIWSPILFWLLLDGKGVASSPSARALSRWALDRGAKEVRFDFDLRFER